MVDVGGRNGYSGLRIVDCGIGIADCRIGIGDNFISKALKIEKGYI